MSTPQRPSPLTKKLAAMGALPVRFLSPGKASRLTNALELTPEQLQQVAGGLARADGCCKPDAGTCCPNKKLTVKAI